MEQLDDSALLRRYVEDGSNDAFGAVVTRHINLVYSVALRQTGSAKNAEEVTQAVFIILARKAAQLRHEEAVSGWLFRTTRLTANNFLRSEMRRHNREQEAYVQSVLNQPEDDLWPKLAPLLDNAVASLREKDRQAILLRFYEGKNLRDVGNALGTSQDAAEKRVSRALEKLRSFFARRGVSSTTGIISEKISMHSVQAAPAALAKAVTVVAAAKGAAASASTLILIKGAMKIMAWSNTKSAILISSAVLLAAGTATLTIKAIENNQTYPWQINERVFKSDTLKRFPPQIGIARTKFPKEGYQHEGRVAIVDFGRDVGRQMLGINRTVKQMMVTVYDGYGDGSVRTIEKARMPKGSYDFIANLPKGSVEGLRAAIKERFGLVGRHETREMDVLFMRLKNPDAPGLKPVDEMTRDGEEAFVLCIDLEDACFHIPVFDETGLKGRFRFSLHLPKAGAANQDLEGLKQELLDRYGLELVPGRAPVDILVIEKAK